MNIQEVLVRLGQDKVLKTYQQFDPEQRLRFETSFASLDIPTLERQIALFNKNRRVPFSPIPPPQIAEEVPTQVGEDSLKAGKIGTIILAGGLGSRLGHEMPKGCYPLSLIKKKSLFQRIAERLSAAKEAFGKRPHLAIMTSGATHEQTITHFSEANFFDLPKESVSFFLQSTLPLLDDRSQLVLSQDGDILSAPDGNGSLFWNFAASGLLDIWKKEGVSCVTVLTVDNPLADPFSLPLISQHLALGCDITVAAVARASPDEKVGLLVEREGKLAVIEYSEMLPEEQEKISKNPVANISFFTISLPFIERTIEQPKCQQPKWLLPLHKAKKKIAHREFWKFEYFLFDVLAYAEKASVVLFDRGDCFYPLKNGIGEYGPAKVQEALLERDRKQFQVISGIAPPVNRLFELGMSFYYPTQELLTRWKQKSLPPDNYLDS